QFAVDGSNVGGPVTVTSGVAASDPISSLAVGIHSVTATYAGVTRFATSTGSLPSQSVIRADTTTTVTPSPNPSAFGQPVTFTATVAPVAPGAGGPTGTVSFFVDGALLQTVPLGDGFATADSIATLAGGTHTVTATYGGDGNFNPNTSAPMTQTVNPAASTITGVTATVNPSVFGQPVTFTATVAPVVPAPGVPTGQVQFFADGTSFGTGTLSEGSTVSPPISSLSVGVHAVTATYLGDPNFATSTGSTAQVVIHASTTSTVVAAPNPSVVGQPVTFSVSITAVGPGTGTPTGTVQFAVDGVNVGDPVTLDGGMATSPPDAGLAVGDRTITANYSGDPNFTSGSGSV